MVENMLCRLCLFFFFFKQKTAYEMRISDWSSDVCSSDLPPFPARGRRPRAVRFQPRVFEGSMQDKSVLVTGAAGGVGKAIARRFAEQGASVLVTDIDARAAGQVAEAIGGQGRARAATQIGRAHV